ncbi:MAG: hypothetical protein OEY52_14920 [Gammaproteobacteria bacterium]|nr:hypothetical protein [Gammaproteobacteria bacterium]
MKGIISLLIVMLFSVSNAYSDTLSFSKNLLAGKTFYIQEDTGYETVAKYYLDNNKLKLFYVIFYKGQLEETDKLDATINSRGRIAYTVFNIPTELELTEVGTKEYVVNEYHSKVHKNTLVLQFEKPDNFARIKKQ